MYKEIYVLHIRRVTSAQRSWLRLGYLAIFKHTSLNLLLADSNYAPH